MTTIESGFLSSLTADGRSPEIPESEDIYGWLVGSWTLEVLDYESNGHVRRSEGAVHFGRVLEGRAVQDVWIMPGRYGTTLRVWDASICAWRVTWINPASGRRNELIGRRIGADVVQVGTHPDGTPIRWIFTGITAGSFRWTGEALETDGKTWRLEAEFRGKRL